MKSEKGFTLLELLTVISIISFLANTAFAVTTTARVKARDAKRFSDIKSIQTAMALYYDDNKEFPLPAGTTADYANGALITALTPYISPVPNDPLFDSQGFQFRYYRQAAYGWGTRVRLESPNFRTGDCQVAPPTDDRNYCKTGDTPGAAWWGTIIDPGNETDPWCPICPF